MDGRRGKGPGAEVWRCSSIFEDPGKGGTNTQPKTESTCSSCHSSSLASSPCSSIEAICVFSSHISLLLQSLQPTDRILTISGNALTDFFLQDVGITQFQFNIGQQLLSAGIVLLEVNTRLCTNDTNR